MSLRLLLMKKHENWLTDIKSSGIPVPRNCKQCGDIFHSEHPVKCCDACCDSLDCIGCKDFQKK